MGHVHNIGCGCTGSWDSWAGTTNREVHRAAIKVFRKSRAYPDHLSGEPYTTRGESRHNSVGVCHNPGYLALHCYCIGLTLAILGQKVYPRAKNG